MLIYVPFVIPETPKEKFQISCALLSAQKYESVLGGTLGGTLLTINKLEIGPTRTLWMARNLI